MVMPVSVPVKLLPPKPGSQGFANSIVAAPSTRDKPASSMSDDEMPVLVRMTLSPPHSPQGAAPNPPAVSCCPAPPAWGGNIPLLSWRWGSSSRVTCLSSNVAWPLRLSTNPLATMAALGIPSLSTLAATQANCLLLYQANCLG